MQIVYVTINRKVNKKPKSIQEETSEPLSSSDNRYLSKSRSIFDLFATIKHIMHLKGIRSFTHTQIKKIEHFRHAHELCQSESG